MASLESGNLTDELAASLTDRCIKYWLAGFVDLHGIPKCKSVPIAHFSDMMADRFTFFWYMVHEIARNHDAFATFMPKPMNDRTGSAVHFNMSLSDPTSGINFFEDSTDPRNCGLSIIGYQFIAGVLRHAKAICAVSAPLVNSYKRLVIQGSMSGFTWAPIYICYGGNNRTNMLRIPSHGNRVECRAPDISCNLYLAAAMMLNAGLEGIREELDPGAPHDEYVHLGFERTSR
jgi:glutamine synthetase